MNQITSIAHYNYSGINICSNDIPTRIEMYHIRKMGFVQAPHGAVVVFHGSNQYQFLTHIHDNSLGDNESDNGNYNHIFSLMKTMLLKMHMFLGEMILLPFLHAATSVN